MTCTQYPEPLAFRAFPAFPKACQRRGIRFAQLSIFSTSAVVKWLAVEVIVSFDGGSIVLTPVFQLHDKANIFPRSNRVVITS